MPRPLRVGRLLGRESGIQLNLIIGAPAAFFILGLEHLALAIADAFGDASILFSDIEGFVPLSKRLAAERTVALLNDMMRRFDALADKYGVEKIKTIGDSYMAVAGLPQPVPDHADRLAHMALD